MVIQLGLWTTSVWYVDTNIGRIRNWGGGTLTMFVQKEKHSKSFILVCRYNIRGLH